MCGKTTFISILSKALKVSKILIIDFDLINNNLHSVFAVKEIPTNFKNKIKDKSFLEEFKLNEKNIKELAVKINRKIDLISKTEIIFDSSYKYKETKMKEVIENLKKYYDIILIDTSSDTKYKELTKILINISDEVICLTLGNLIYIRKTMNILKENMDKKSKIKLVYNKKTKYTLNSNVLRIVFNRFKLIGKLSYDVKYEKIINKNVNSIFINKKIKEELKKIASQL